MRIIVMALDIRLLESPTDIRDIRVLENAIFHKQNKKEQTLRKYFKSIKQFKPTNNE